MAVEHEKKITGTHNQDLVAQLAAQIAAGMIARLSGIAAPLNEQFVVDAAMSMAKKIFEASRA
jgi:hypothetical protein